MIKHPITVISQGQKNLQADMVIVVLIVITVVITVVMEMVYIHT